MAQAKTYQEYLAERTVALDETIAEFKMAPGSKEMDMLQKFVANVDQYQELMFRGDEKSRFLAFNIARDFNNNFYADLDKLYRSPNPDDKASAAVAERAIQRFSGKVRGPSIFERIAVEPYYDKKEGIKWGGIGSAAIGAGLGGLLAYLWSSMGGNLGPLQTIGLTLFMGLAGGAFIPTAIEWLGDQFSGKKATPAPGQSPVAAPAVGKSQAQATGHDTPAQRSSTQYAGYASSSSDKDIPDDVKDKARNAMRRQSRAGTEELGGPGSGNMPHIPHGNQPYNRPIRYTNTFFTPTAIPQEYAGSYYGNRYAYGANNISPTGIPPFPQNRFGGLGNGAFTAGSTGVGNFGFRPFGFYGNPYGLNNGTYYTRPYGLNAGHAGYYGLAGGHYVPPDRIAGVDTSNIPDIGGFRFNPRKGMQLPKGSSGFLLDGHFDEKKAIEENPLALPTPLPHHPHHPRGKSRSHGHGNAY